jgi:tol-pal system protein YbgF
MKWLRIALSVMLVMLVVVLCMAMGCSGSQKVKLATEQAALSGGLEGSTAVAGDTGATAKDEDEVMRLLGLSHKEESAIMPSPAAAAALEEKGEALDDQIQDKEREIEALKTELAQRERRILELEGGSSPSGDGKTRVQGSGSYEERYNHARQLYEARKYKQAIQEFAALLSTSTRDRLSDNAQYWLGECYYGLRAYNQAIVEFEKVFTFNQSDKNDAAQLKLGLCYLRIGNVEKAKIEFQKVIDNYPSSEYIPKAQYYLQTL